MKDMTDQLLLEETSVLVKIERQTTAKVLEHLCEIDRRRLWLKEGYSSLFDFCVRFLNYSEGEAARRIQAARCVENVAAVKPLLETNALSLTGISLIAPFVTKENAAALLPQVERKSRREIEKVLHEQFPESRPQEEFLRIALDEEMKILLAEAQRELSEKDQGIVIKRVLRRFLTKKRERKSSVAKHTRYVPVALRREVMAEAGHQCTYQSKSGVRCNQTAHLQVDHVRDWAKGGSSLDKKNLRPLCRAHNLMRARESYPNVARAISTPLAARTNSSARINSPLIKSRVFLGTPPGQTMPG